MDYEEKLEAFYRRIPLEKCSIIDVGAHIGRHAIPLAQLVGDEGVVHAFEPIPYIRRLLNQNLEGAGLQNVIVYPFALTEERRRVQFHYMPSAAGQSGVKARQSYIDPAAEPELLDLCTRRLDDVTPLSGIHFIKIDIEGGELDMLRGAERTLTLSRPIVAFECGAEGFLSYHDRPEDLFTLFMQKGYAIYSILGERIPDAQVFRQESHAQRVWDYVALPFERIDLAQHLAA